MSIRLVDVAFGAVAGAGRASQLKLIQDAEKFLTQSIDTKHLIPRSWLSPIGRLASLPETSARFQKEFTTLSQADQARFESGNFNAFDDSDKVAEYLSRQVRFIERTHRGYFIGLLKASERLLLRPGIPMGIEDVRAELDVPLYLGRSIDRIRFGVAWQGLKRRTIQEKQKLSAPSQVFWRHTGRGRNAFLRRSQEIIGRARSPGSFLQSGGQALASGLAVRPSPVKDKVAEGRFKFKIGIPESGDSRMDLLILAPFATGRTDIGVIASIKPKGQHENLLGLDRLVNAESTRPMLRKLSAQARAAMLAKLK